LKREATFASEVSYELIVGGKDWTTVGFEIVFSDCMRNWISKSFKLMMRIGSVTEVCLHGNRLIDMHFCQC
jgi:hypothetical protein